MPATLYLSTGESRPIAPANGTDFTFEELYPVLETDCIEVIPLHDGRLMLVDENGTFKPSPQTNDLATVLAPFAVTGPGGIVGHAVVCTTDMLQ